MQLNCHGRENVDQMKECYAQTLDLNLFLIILIRWSSFDSNYWNCSNSEKYWLHYSSCGKYRMNCHGGENCWPNEIMWSSKFEFEPILTFSIWWSSSDPSYWNWSDGKRTELF